MAKIGIDISSHQGYINLFKLKSQVDFVIIRVGYGVSGTLDTNFRRNADLCVELGIPIGFYWYSYALDVEGSRREALSFINAIEPYKNYIKYGCWFDMEDADGYKAKHGMPSNELLRQMCAMFCKIVEDSGYYAGIYASKSWFDSKLNGSEIKSYDKWVAQWPTSNGKQTGLSTDANSKSGVSLWQFTSEGSFTGYNGMLDTNYAYHDFPNPITGEKVSEKKTNSEIVSEIMDGLWGNGEERKQKLINAGYNYEEIQKLVNSRYEKYYEVKKGDTLSGIGVKLGCDWREIAKNNNILPPYTIYPGQKLKY